MQSQVLTRQNFDWILYLLFCCLSIVKQPGVKQRC